MTRRQDLTSPRQGRRIGVSYDSEAFGQFAETIARYLGTARFIVIQTFIVIVWIASSDLWRKRLYFPDHAGTA